MEKLLHAIFSKAGAAWSGGSLIAIVIGIMIQFDMRTDERIHQLELKIQKLEFQIEMMNKENG